MYFLKLFSAILFFMITTKLSWSMDEVFEGNLSSLGKCTRKLIKNIKKLNENLNEEQYIKKSQMSDLCESTIQCFHCNIVLKQKDQINNLIMHLIKKHNANITEVDNLDPGWYIGYKIAE